MAQVRIGSEVREYPIGTRFEEIAKEYQHTMENDIVLVWENNRLRELHKCVTEDCSLAFLTTGDKMGFNAYRRSMSMLMVKAVYHEGSHDHIEKGGRAFCW